MLHVIYRSYGGENRKPRPDYYSKSLALQRGILRSPAYLAAKRPLSIGIAGDSGVGKDTLSDGIAALFGLRAIATVSGDDYHHWDRNKPMWQALTHLNPKANELAAFERDVTHLVDR